MTTATEETPPLDHGRFAAAIYDPFLWLGERRGMRAQRRDLLAQATGRVLEIGAGTGLNAGHYPEDVEDLVLAEPDGSMADRLEARLAGSPGVRVVRAAAESLPFEDGSFDTVVSTLVLCTVTDPQSSLAEIRRVLAPGGKLLFCEHVRAESERLARWQDRLAGPWAGFASGCQCNRPTVETIAAELDLVSTETARWRGMPAIVKPLVTGEARA
jgi:ubiquinone/menaquinone biosynthesis C-methylase UbiE